jgi:hypothetical protein
MPSQSETDDIETGLQSSSSHSGCCGELGHFLLAVIFNIVLAGIFICFVALVNFAKFGEPQGNGLTAAKVVAVFMWSGVSFAPGGGAVELRKRKLMWSPALCSICASTFFFGFIFMAAGGWDYNWFNMKA